MVVCWVSVLRILHEPTFFVYQASCCFAVILVLPLPIAIGHDMIGKLLYDFCVSSCLLLSRCVLVVTSCV
jgi:hypothetical protein